MSNPFYDLYNAMKRSEKEVLISGSGSTPQGKNEKNRSGQSYLYKRHGMESEVIEIRLKKKVSGSRLLFKPGAADLHQTVSLLQYQTGGAGLLPSGGQRHDQSL